MLTKDNVLALWNTDDYKKIANFLIYNAGGNNKSYLKGKLLNNEDVMVVEGHSYTPSEIVAFLNSIMLPFEEVAGPSPSNTIYYRGDSNFNIPSTCIKENYTSVTNIFDHAFQHIKNINTGLLSLITIDKDVKCIKTHVDGELLLEPGCLWHVLRHTIDYNNFMNQPVRYNRIDVIIKSPWTKPSTSIPLCSTLISDSILGTLSVRPPTIASHLQSYTLTPFSNETLVNQSAFSQDLQGFDEYSSLLSVNN
jgi:hypothetical protein